MTPTKWANVWFVAAGYLSQGTKATIAHAGGKYTYTAVMVNAHAYSRFTRFVTENMIKSIVAGIREAVVCSGDRPGYGLFEK